MFICQVSKLVVFSVLENATGKENYEMGLENFENIWTEYLARNHQGPPMTNKKAAETIKEMLNIIYSHSSLWYEKSPSLLRGTEALNKAIKVLEETPD